MNNKTEIIKLYNLGKQYYIHSKYKEAISTFSKIISIATNKEFCDYVAHSIDFLGHCYKSIGYNLFDMAEEEYFTANDCGEASYINAKENFKKAIPYLMQARKMFKTNEVIEKITKEKAKIYVQRCNDVILSCNEHIERCDDRISFVK